MLYFSASIRITSRVNIVKKTKRQTTQVMAVTVVLVMVGGGSVIGVVSNRVDVLLITFDRTKDAFDETLSLKKKKNAGSCVKDQRQKKKESEREKERKRKKKEKERERERTYTMREECVLRHNRFCLDFLFHIVHGDTPRQGFCRSFR